MKKFNVWYGIAGESGDCIAADDFITNDIYGDSKTDAIKNAIDYLIGEIRSNVMEIIERSENYFIVANTKNNSRQKYEFCEAWVFEAEEN